MGVQYSGPTALGHVDRAGFTINEKQVRTYLAREFSGNFLSLPHLTFIKKGQKAEKAAKAFADAANHPANAYRKGGIRRYLPPYLSDSLLGGNLRLWTEICDQRFKSGAGFEIIAKEGDAMAWCSVDGIDWFKMTADVSYAGVINPAVTSGKRMRVHELAAKTAAIAMRIGLESWTMLTHIGPYDVPFSFLVQVAEENKGSLKVARKINSYMFGTGFGCEYFAHAPGDIVRYDDGQIERVPAKCFAFRKGV